MQLQNASIISILIVSEYYSNIILLFLYGITDRRGHLRHSVKKNRNEDPPPQRGGGLEFTHVQISLIVWVACLAKNEDQ